MSVVTVGAGLNGDNYRDGGNGGALSWKNNISVIPGNSYTIVVPAGGSVTRASFGGNTTVSAGNYTSRTGQGGGDGGYAETFVADTEGGGGGAGGYMGAGGAGAGDNSSGAPGSGGGG